jgi:succinyl-CoA synthetase beta subunit
MGIPKVKGILFNIFGGITRCDDIAEGILMARDRIDITIPVVIRLIGTNDEKGRKMLSDAGVPAAENLDEAVKKIVAEVKEGGVQ